VAVVQAAAVRPGAIDLLKAVELASQRRYAVGIAEKPAWEDRSEIACRPLDDGVSSGPCSADGSIRRATEADRPNMMRFRADALVMADDRDIDADTCADTRVVQNEDNACPTWIAENSERIVGAITLALSGQWLARVAGLWVDPSLRDSRVPDDLLRQALQFCRDAGILKVVLHTHLPGDEAWTVFHNCGFNITRDRQREGRNVRDFYLDLYKRPKCEQPKT